MKRVTIVREREQVSFELFIPSLTVEKGEFIMVLGPSGCGKSTFLDTLGLLLKPTAAEEFVLNIGTGSHPFVDAMGAAGNELASIRKKGIGYVLQTGGLLPFLSVQENIVLPCRLNRIPDGLKRVDELTRFLGISDQIKKKPQYLSGGQRQRAAIARALIHEPPLVLADEPTAAVDKLTGMEIIKKFKEYTQTIGSTVVMVTHDKTLASHVADRALLFHIEKRGENKTCAVLTERAHS